MADTFSHVFSSVLDVHALIKCKSVTKGPKFACSIDQNPDDDPFKYLEENNENSWKFQFKQVDTNYVKTAFMVLKIQNRLGLKKFLRNF